MNLVFYCGAGLQVLGLAGWLRAYRGAADRAVVDAAFDAVQAVVYAMHAVGTLLLSDAPWLSVLWAAAAGVFAWSAWRNWRKRRRRKPSLVLGVVRNLGHRLTVAPVPGGAR